jgi:hypothetical protein
MCSRKRGRSAKQGKLGHILVPGCENEGKRTVQSKFFAASFVPEERLFVFDHECTN